MRNGDKERPFKSEYDALIKFAEVFDEPYFSERDAKDAIRGIKAAVKTRPDAAKDVRRIELCINGYFRGVKRNLREERRFLNQSRRRLKRKQRGKLAPYNIKPAKIMDVRRERARIAGLIRELADSVPRAET